MGVRGLTTFIAKNSNRYLENYQLHDTYLVLDGNNIASHLYKWHCTRNDCFGGDYDKFAKTIYNFFKLLEDCNVIPLIVFDGSYEDKKLQTIYSRFKNKIRLARNVNSVTQGSLSMFPLFVRELFVDIVRELNLKAVRCDYEADYEMACLARSLNCPILSYDSDFYIFDVLYIPFSTFEMNLHKLENSSPPSYYIYCRLYRIERFMRSFGDLKKENLPLVATLLGNDYINKSVFRNFYDQIKLAKRKRVKTDQQRKIISVIKWMQSETYDSAVKKILGRLKAKQRKHVAEQIQNITEGYVCTNSKYMQYLNIEGVETGIHTSNINCDVTKILTDIDNEAESDVNDQAENSEDESDSGATSDSESESDDLGPDVEILEVQELCEGVIPWFMDKYRRCDYPAAFLDIVLRNRYFCTPQIEDYSNTCSHHISVNILSAINKILSSGTAPTLTYVARSENLKYKHYTTPVCDMELPKLADLEDLDPEIASNVLLQILEVNSDVVRFTDNLPKSWQLYVLAIIYWIRNAKPKVAYCHVYSVILCMFVLNKVDAQIGFHRSNVKFLTKFEKKINSLLKCKDVNKIESNELTQLFDNISYEDCLLCMKETIKYFQMEERMTCQLKLFDVQILDCFAQLQSCLMHVKYLNTLLNGPFEDFLVSRFYDGTFLYNMCVNFMKRTDIDVYLGVLLKNSPEILNCFRVLVDGLVKILSDNFTTVTKGKRRRKKKNRSNRKDSVGEDASKEEDSEDDGVVDANNRFALLHLVK